mmetsp:Transcript_63833/g.122710  ORF Transcript_63833/g.122710 Transcript_63833/m.122710 type:complete len:173 (-) Transcript_63833:261-779(-)
MQSMFDQWWSRTCCVRDYLLFDFDVINHKDSDDDDDYAIADSIPGLSELGCAARCGHAATVETLLCNCADPNVRDMWGQTPLFHAANSGDLSTVASLMLARADPTRTSHAGLSALDVVNDIETQALMHALGPLASNRAPAVGDLVMALEELPDEKRERFEEAMGCDNRSLGI